MKRQRENFMPLEIVGSIIRKKAVALALALVSVVVVVEAPAFADPGFQRWIAQFKSVAGSNGISANTYNRAFAGVTSPDPEVLEKARNQPEFNAPVWQYFDNQVNEGAVAAGRQMARKWKSWLDRIERRFGVDRHILLAIWSVESNYGDILDNERIVRSVPRSLATLAYADKRRAKFARSQLIAALKILQTGDIDVGHLTGSWAGAMGHTQFIPTSYQAFAVDMDGDGRRDIWNSVPDALATAANLLRRSGWRTGETWGYEVTLPGGRKFPGGWMSLSKWNSIGVDRVGGRNFPRPSDSAELKVPDGRAGPAFLVLKNFAVLKRYNNADKYALAVGLLADQIAGHGGLGRDWNRPFTPLDFAEKEELQKHLKVLGFYDGEIDGKIGSGSQAAIKAYQARVGLTQDGYPSKEVLSALRRR